MALGGAWVVAAVGTNVVRLTGRTWGADADVDTIGLFGDATAGAQLPAAWYANGIAVATLVANVIAVLNPVTDSAAAGPTAGGMFRITKAAGPPFQISITWDGAAPAAPVQPEVYVIWPHTLIQ